LPARPIRRVEILELCLALRRFDRAPELRRQLALLLDRREDRAPSRLELDQILALLLDAADLNLVEPAGSLLAVARDERHRAAFVEERDHGSDAGTRQPQSLADRGNRVVSVGSGAGLVGHKTGRPYPPHPPTASVQPW